MSNLHLLLLVHVLSLGLMISAALGAAALHTEFKRDGRTWQFALSLFLVFVLGTAMLGYAHFWEYLLN